MTWSAPSLSCAGSSKARLASDQGTARTRTCNLDQNRFDSYQIATYSKVGKLAEAQEIAAEVLARLTQTDRKKAAIILEDIATAHLARRQVNDAARVAQSGLAVMFSNIRIPSREHQSQPYCDIRDAMFFVRSLMELDFPLPSRKDSPVW